VKTAAKDVFRKKLRDSEREEIREEVLKGFKIHEVLEDPLDGDADL
jgi:hypothetical protein